MAYIISKKISFSLYFSKSFRTFFLSLYIIMSCVDTKTKHMRYCWLINHIPELVKKMMGGVKIFSKQTQP